jgi:hypothetical protein
MLTTVESMNARLEPRTVASRTQRPAVVLYRMSDGPGVVTG